MRTVELSRVWVKEGYWQHVVGVKNTLVLPVSINGKLDRKENKIR